MSAIGTDAEFNAANAFFNILKSEDTEGSSKENEDEHEDTSEDAEVDEDEDTSEETPEDDQSDEDEGEEGEDSDEEGEEEAEKPKKGKRTILEADADAVVKHKVDGKEVEIPVKDLTRLYGQEAALTRKSQELAEQRKTADTTAQKHAVALETLLTRAKDAYAPYEKLNFFALAKDPNITAEELNALQNEARKAYDNVAFLQSELSTAVNNFQETRQKSLREAAQVAWNTLADPNTGIEGWSEPLYNDVRTYAISHGIDKNIINELVDPAAIKLLHKAMLYDKGKKALTQTVKKTAKSPKKIIKGTAETVGKTKANSVGDAKALAALKRSGKPEDAEAVFLARMSTKE